MPMNHDENTIDLDLQIQLESEHEKRLADKTALKFKSSDDLLAFLKRLPINRNVELTSLAPFLRRLRTNAYLDLKDVSIAVKLPADLIVQFESPEVFPWTLPASAMVELACAYRIHIEAIEFLTKNSYQLAKLSKTMADPDATFASMAEWLKAVQSEMNAHGDLTLTT
jgi:hypothetical protein